mgnify:CR=1
LNESSKAFQNRSSYNIKVPKRQAKALVEDVEFSNMPSSDRDKKGFIDSLFSFFKSDEEANQKKPVKKFSPDRNRNK